MDCIHGLDILEKDVPMHMLPSMFTRVESAANYHFKPDLQPHIIEEDKEPDKPGLVLMGYTIVLCRFSLVLEPIIHKSQL